MIRRETVLNVLPIIFTVGTGLMIMILILGNQQATLTNREVGKVNQTYNRVVACLASVSPTRRTPEYTKQCYDLAEKASGVRVERYGDGR